MKPNHGHLPYSLTIACSSTLLFLVQPIIAKAILPRFGGSAGVWVTCMLFFQVVLLIGYLYAYLITRHLSGKAQTAVHLVLLVASLGVLPLRPRSEWTAAASPLAAILFLLTTSVGLPYFVLATTSPLLQSWYAGSGARFPYRLFALSNAASLVALLSYPVAIEPVLRQQQQLLWWSGAYFVFVLLASFAAVGSRGHAERQSVETGGKTAGVTVALAACASTLWLATANHLSQEVAAIPFLWILPLSLYLLSFILCFESHGWYRRAIFRWLLPAAWIAVCFRIARQGLSGGLEWEIPVMSAALFVCCMFCHGELAASKPEPKQGLAYFYLMVALGGALGAVFVGVVAPNLFNTYLELPIGITASVLLALPLLYGFNSPARLIRVGVVAAVAFAVATRFSAAGQEVVRIRNFYGAIQVIDTGSGETAVRALYNGRTRHGAQFLSPARSRLATAYFGPESGAGRVFESFRASGRRVGIIGLGAGTLAAYGRPGDHFRFFEINPAVIEVASRYFRFLAESDAQTDVVAGDGRLTLQREPPRSFDVIVLDAFSDDSIPIHLLTVEAFQVYFDHLRPGGVLALHITNRYLDLYPVVAAAAEGLGKKVLPIHSEADPERQVSMADWAVLSDSGEVLQDLARFGQQAAPAKKVRLWTDDYSNLFGVLR
ncbi:Integral membrane protein-like protein [Candidatus Sulfopaludibacter sp. SbA6]|nr:Integral membrane protein-like protein [Candidatus Sulfopaludibacter sp. SbA6]